MPFALTYPARYTEEIEIQTPDDWEFEHKPKEVATPYFTYVNSGNHTDRTVHLSYVYQALKDNVPTDGMGAFLENYDKMKDDLGYELTSSAIEHAPSSGGGKGLDLSDRTKVWLCVILLGVIVYFVRRR